MAKYHVSITIHKAPVSVYGHLGEVHIYHKLEVEADSEEQAEAKVRDLSMYGALDYKVCNIKCVEVLQHSNVT